MLLVFFFGKKLWHGTVAVGWLAPEGLCRAWIIIGSLSLSDSPSLNELFVLKARPVFVNSSEDIA